ncbi:MAG: holo-ACP synthase [Phycisphaerales bacterium]|jgi:holo-[acyl-carrier protein] synthase|nr:holo-ACP synthase [Phycisphaeraceae bacterium]
MRIVGHGVDIVEVSRIARLLREHGERFIERTYTPDEASLCRDTRRSDERFASRFAMKEAVVKALGTGFAQGVAHTDVQTLNDSVGRPVVTLTGGAARVARELGITQWQVSLSDSEAYCIASAIAIAT